jgi:anti-sigma factor RsiW
MTPPPLQITCKEFVELVTTYLDGVLPDHDRLRFESHAERCPGCHAYLGQFRQTIEALKSVPPEPAEPENLDELTSTFATKPPADPAL